MLDRFLRINKSDSRDVLCRSTIRRVMDLKQQIRSRRYFSSEPGSEYGRILTWRETYQQLALQTRCRAGFLHKHDHVMNNGIGATANLRRCNIAIFFEVRWHRQILVINNSLSRNGLFRSRE